MLAFLAALAFACVATTGLVEQRLARGGHVSLWIGAASLACAIQLVLSARRGSAIWTKIHTAHVLGAVTGVLVGCVLALVWAVAAPALRSRLVWLAIALVPSFAYFRTPGYWHCDHFDGFPVQHYVAAQLTIAFDIAVALVAYLTTDRRAA
jgi:hypothetical protein